ncbi:hypothetical protein HK097_001050 [Rhizophlyctis rosea]|uniref:Uncharacterized protein n=1 Tax=Rhizophlyctis rosea TaxID=64517 RepID=A0AAD5SHK1_9FUNG|nr:hypothetical protein HK097_001050 [Rhizophlyctis rosea]
MAQHISDSDLPPTYQPAEEKVALLHEEKTEQSLPTPATANPPAPQRRRHAARFIACVLILIFLIAPLLCTIGDGDGDESHIHKHKGKGKHHKKPKHSKKCKGDIISHDLPDDYEPSDLVWDKPSSTLFVASDSGRFAGIDTKGKLKGEWDLGDNFDLEGIALSPYQPGLVYLGQEAPPSIIEFNTTSSSITRRWNITAPADPDKNKCDALTLKANGIESLVFIASRNSPNGGFFYAGRQCDARVFVYDIPLEGGNDGKVVYRGYIDPPGPGYDLAAMTAFNEVLYLVYDEDKVVHALDLTDPTFIPPPLPPPSGNTTAPEWIIDATKKDATEYDLVFDRRGQEGMTFAEVRGTQHDRFVFVAIDPPKHKGRKLVVKYELEEFWECFEEKDEKKRKGRKFGAEEEEDEEEFEGKGRKVWGEEWERAKKAARKAAERSRITKDDE